MQITFKMIEEIAVVELDGRIDSRTAPDIEAAIVGQKRPGVKVVMDMSQVTYMSSAGLRLLVNLQRALTEGGGELALAGLMARVADTMSVTGFLQYFSVFETVGAALAALK
jgi:anti-sigma B factor antagonist